MSTLSEIENSIDIVSKYQKNLFRERDHLNDPYNEENNEKNNELHTFWMSGVKDDKILGEGAYGSTILSCDKNNICYAIKKQSIKTPLYRGYFDTELRCLIENRTLDFIPRVFSAWIKDGYGYIVMEKLEEIEEKDKNNITEIIEKYLEKLKENGWIHNDVHPGNIMIKKNKSDKSTFVLIDFGLSIHESSKYLDIFYRTHSEFNDWECINITQRILFLEHFKKYNKNNDAFKKKIENYRQSLKERVNIKKKTILEKIKNIENISEEKSLLLKYVMISENFPEIIFRTLFKEAEKNAVKEALSKKLDEYRNRDPESNKNDIEVFIDNLINPNKQKEKDAINDPERIIPKSVSSRYKNLIMFLVGNDNNVKNIILDILPSKLKELYDKLSMFPSL